MTARSANDTATGRWTDVLGLAALGIALVCLVDPRGDFPLNDDWSFAAPVRSWIETGRIRYHPFTAMSLLAQIGWGTLFCLPTGFSYEALRASTLVAGAIGVGATYWLALEAGGSRGLARVLALAVGLWPVYLNLAHTFMTDVPHYTASVLAALFLVRWLRRGGTTSLVLGIVFACATTLVRQIGLVIPVAFGLALLARDGPRGRTFAVAALPTVVAAAVYFVFELWLESIGRPAAYGYHTEKILRLWESGPDRFGLQVAVHLLFFCTYLGVFLLPLLPWVVGGLRSARRRWPVIALAVIAFAVPFALRPLLSGPILPRLGNVAFDFGLGPASLRDVYLLGMPHLPRAPEAVWLVLSGVGLATFAVAVGACLASRAADTVTDDHDRRFRRALVVFSVAAFALYLAPGLGTPDVFDRFLLVPQLALALGVVALCGRARPWAGSTSAERWPAALSAVSLIAFATFGVAGTHDYLAWQRARWALLEEMTGPQGIDAARIDGGFEYCGMLFADGPHRPDPSKSWWWVQDDEYVVAFGPLPGYEPVDERSYPRWLPPGKGRVVALRRAP